LTRADLTRASLYRADLTRADLTRASLYRADLTRADLTRASLYRADLTRADLTRANLTRADLTGANLTGANLTDANLIIGGQRSDGYQFFGYRDGDRLHIKAGCRYFSAADAKEHWNATRKGTQLGNESLALVDHLVTMAKIAGWET
jgi:uncharacterized protein YjbI with pentapeptide repeats